MRSSCLTIRLERLSALHIRTAISISRMVSLMKSPVNPADMGSSSNVECVITIASQSPVATRATNSRRRSPARSSFVAMSTAAEG